MIVSMIAVNPTHPVHAADISRGVAINDLRSTSVGHVCSSVSENHSIASTVLSQQGATLLCGALPSAR
jgi:hypothetical protein